MNDIIIEVCKNVAGVVVYVCFVLAVWGLAVDHLRRHGWLDR